MSTIFISNDAGGRTPYPEFQAREMWRQGLISRHANYWREGMTDWRPVTEFFEPEEADADELHVLPGPPPVARGFARDPGILTHCLVVMLWISFAGSVMATLLGGVLLAAGQAGSSTREELSPPALAQGLLALGQVVVFIVTGIIFLRWVHRANVNARGLGATGMRFTPGWCVGWFFIPIACLWKPYQAMKEIWQASSNPQSWFRELAPSLLGTWWGLWLLSNFLGQAAFRLNLQNSSGAELASLLSDLVDIPLCLVAMKLVKEIYERQRSWAERPAEI